MSERSTTIVVAPTHGISASASTHALYNSGVRKLAANNLEQAAAIFTSVIELEPSFAPAFHNLGHIAQQTHEFDSARRHYLSAIAIDASYAPSHNNLGVLLRDVDDAASLRHSLIAAQLSPENAHLTLNAAYRLSNVGRAMDALELIDTSLRVLGADNEDASLLAVRNAIICPAVFRNSTEASWWWHRSSRMVRQILDSDVTHHVRDPSLFGVPPFGLTYTSHPTTNLFSDLAALLVKYAPSLAHVHVHHATSQAHNPTKRRVRACFILENHANTSPMKLLYGVIRNIDRSSIHVRIFPMLRSPSGNTRREDVHTSRLKVLADAVTYLSGEHLNDARNAVSAAKCDALVYSAVGMSKMVGVSRMT